jgi:hypothetical protein
VVLQVFVHVVVVVETKKNEDDFDENVMVAESVVIANYRLVREVMMVEYLVLIILVVLVKQDLDLERK